MLKDEIIAEVWRLRDEYVNKHRHDLDAILADLRQRQRHPLSRLVDRRKRRPSTATRRRCPTKRPAVCP